MALQPRGLLFELLSIQTFQPIIAMCKVANIIEDVPTIDLSLYIPGKNQLLLELVLVDLTPYGNRFMITLDSQPDTTICLTL